MRFSLTDQELWKKIAKLASLVLLCLTLGILYGLLFYHKKAPLAILITGVVCGAILGISFLGHVRFRKIWGTVSVFLLPIGMMFSYNIANFHLSVGMLVYIVNAIIIFSDNLIQGKDAPSCKGHYSKPLGLLLASHALSLFFAVEPLWGFIDLSMLALAGTMYIYLRRYFTTKEEVVKLIKTFAIVTLYIYFIAMMEYVRQGNYNITLSTFQGNTALSGENYRVNGAFNNPNSYGFFAGASSLLYGGMFFYFRKKKNKLWTLFSLLLFILGGITLFFSYSRGAFVAYLSGLLFMIMTLPTGGRRVIVWVFALAVFASVLVYIFVYAGEETRLASIAGTTSITQRFSEAQTPEQQANLIASVARPALWLIGLGLWTKQPIFGIGHGMTVFRIGPYLPLVLRPIHHILYHFHSIFFNTLYEKGIVGFAMLIWFLFRLVDMVFGGIRHRGKFTGFASIALGAVWIHLFVHSLVDTVFAVGNHYVEAGIFFFFVFIQSFLADQVLARRKREKEKVEAEQAAAA